MGQHHLDIFKEGEDQWDVWLDTEVAEYDGICLGCGETQTEAVIDAIETLEHALRGARQLVAQGPCIEIAIRPHRPVGQRKIRVTERSV